MPQEIGVLHLGFCCMTIAFLAPNNPNSSDIPIFAFEIADDGLHLQICCFSCHLMAGSMIRRFAFTSFSSLMNRFPFAPRKLKVNRTAYVLPCWVVHTLLSQKVHLPVTFAVSSHCVFYEIG